MRKTFVLITLLLIWCPLATAQNYPVAELSGGYSNYWVHSTSGISFTIRRVRLQMPFGLVQDWSSTWEGSNGRH